MSRRPKEIIVRSRYQTPAGKWETEWMKKTRSWKKAWEIVDGCGADREEARRHSETEHSVFLDIGGGA